MNNHRNSPVAAVWDLILAEPAEPLTNIKGTHGERTPLYAKLFKRKGVYVVRDGNGRIVYAGIAGGGEKEGGLADRLWSHIQPVSVLRKRLKEKSIELEDCTVAVHQIECKKDRRRAEMYGIAVTDPLCNVD